MKDGGAAVFWQYQGDQQSEEEFWSLPEPTGGPPMVLGFGAIPNGRGTSWRCQSFGLAFCRAEAASQPRCVDVLDVWGSGTTRDAERAVGARTRERYRFHCVTAGGGQRFAPQLMLGVGRLQRKTACTRRRDMDKNPPGHTVPFIGTWKLVSFEIRTDRGAVVYPFGEDAQGSIIYTASGHFSVQIRRTHRPHFASGDQLKGTVEEIEASYKGYLSYCGLYDFDLNGGFVVHRVEGSLFPNWEGQGLKRYCTFSDNRLTLTTPPTLWGGRGEIIGTLVWERVG